MRSDAGGERAAAMYSLIGTAKLNGLDPHAYLRHVFERIADHPINRIDELLPWNVAAQIARDTAEQRLAARFTADVNAAALRRVHAEAGAAGSGHLPA